MKPIPLGTYMGVPLRICPSGYVVGGIMLLFNWSLFALILACVILVSIVLHEYGHVYAAKKRGLPVIGVDLMMFGGIAKIEMNNINGYDQFWVGIAGPIVTIIIATICTGMVWLLTPNHVACGIFYLIAVLNVYLLLFNLCLPIYPMDGGRIISGLLAIYTRIQYVTSIKICVWIACIVAPFAMIYFIMINAWIAAMIVPMMVLAAFGEYSAVKDRIQQVALNKKMKKVQKTFVEELLNAQTQNQRWVANLRRAGIIPDTEDDPFGESQSKR